MRRWSSISKATALEILSEPLSLLLLLAALCLTVFAPAFHYHQFGEATRMARDAGFSALFTCGTALAIFGTLKSYRRELETGTAAMALAHPVSRTAFFVAKLIGAVGAYLFFCVIVAASELTITRGAELGALWAQENGDIAKLWGPSFTIGVATILLPLALAAALNRFARFRFVLTSFVTAFLVSVGGIFYKLNLSLAIRLAPIAVAIILPALALLIASAAASVRFKTNGAATVIGIVFAVSLPAIGNYYLPDALANGACLAWSYVGWAALALVPALAAFLLLGIHFIKECDLS